MADASDRIRVAPEELRLAAVRHRETSEQLDLASASHGDIMVSLDSLGPIFSEFRDAGRELLEQRRVCYQRQASAHADLAGNLSLAADAWEQQDLDAARSLRGVSEDGA